MRIILLITIALGLSSCSTISYYGQSIQGQLSLLSKRQNIEGIIQNPDSPDSLKTRLQQAAEIRQFASQKLHLPDNQSYLKYADLKRSYVVWNVFAAPEFSLTPKTWCYFIVGCVSYRGYFDEQNAISTAATLAEENYDVHVAGIAAYSTLGWFDDPILNTMLNWNERALASLMFHELSHQVIYISSETGFNEAFSSAVERIGTIQWLLSNTQPIDRYLSYLAAQQDFRELLLSTRDKLNLLYSTDLDPNIKREKKKEIIAQMKNEYTEIKAKWGKGIHFDSWFAKPINNARLTSTMTYLHKIPAFYQIFSESHGNWQTFYETVIAMKEMNKEERDALIQEKLSNAPSISSLVELVKTNVRE